MTEQQAPATRQDWRIAGIYHLYRLVIACLILALLASGLETDLLQMVNPARLRLTAWLYLASSLAAPLITGRTPGQTALLGLALTDLGLLLLLCYLGGGPASGLGNLIVVAVALASILLPGRPGLLLAVLAALGLTSLTFLLSLRYPDATPQHVQAGVLGILCFAATLLTRHLSQRLQSSENLAQQRGADLSRLQGLNTLILQQMRTGVLLVSPAQTILQANPAARHLLDQMALEGQPLQAISPALNEQLQRWQQNPGQPLEDLPGPAGRRLQPDFARLALDEHPHLLVFLDDAAIITRQAQQMKLAALGRLTASIAHEIRNPLGAISHAAQLLQESPTLPAADQKLLQIIRRHTRRMDQMIDSILQLSRHRPARTGTLELCCWLEAFVAEWQLRLEPTQQLHLERPDQPLPTRVDGSQLQQVLDNLIQNGLRHSGQQHPEARIWLKLAMEPASAQPLLDVIDNGPGIPADQRQHLFEPFFTTDPAGTGLGLYLCRALCTSNQIHIEYHDQPGGGSCFRLLFARPDPPVIAENITVRPPAQP